MATRIPGVRVSIETDVGIIQNAPFDRIPVIVALGDPYQERRDVTVTRSATDGVGDAASNGDTVTVTDSQGNTLTPLAITRLGAFPGGTTWTVGSGKALGTRTNAIAGVTPVVADYSTVDGPGALYYIVDVNNNASLAWYDAGDALPTGDLPTTGGTRIATGIGSSPAIDTDNVINGVVRLTNQSGTGHLYVSVPDASKLPAASQVEIVLVGNHSLITRGASPIPGVTVAGATSNAVAGAGTGPPALRAFTDASNNNYLKWWDATSGTLDTTTTGAVQITSTTGIVAYRLPAANNTSAFLYVLVDHSTFATANEDDISVGNALTPARTNAYFDPINSRLHWDPNTLETVTRPPRGTTYYVTVIITTPTEQYDPTLYQDESDLIAENGGVTLSAYTRSLMADSSVNPEYVDPLVAAASLVFDAGAPGVILARLRPTDANGNLVTIIPGELDLSTQAHQDAILNAWMGAGTFEGLQAKLERISNAKLYIVPVLDVNHCGEDILSGTLGLNELIHQHTVNMSAPVSASTETRERTTIGTLSLDPQGRTITTKANGQRDPSNIKAYVDSFDSVRMILMAPERTFVTPFQNRYHNGFAAAALAGMLSAVSVGLSLTDDVIPGISLEATELYNRAEIESLLGVGTTVLKQDGSQSRIVMALTTDVTNAVTESANIQEIADYLRINLRTLLWSRFKKVPITSNTPPVIANFISTYFASEPLVVAFRNVTAKQDTTEPRLIIINAEVQPRFTAEYIDMNLTFVASI